MAEKTSFYKLCYQHQLRLLIVCKFVVLRSYPKINLSKKFKKHLYNQIRIFKNNLCLYHGPCTHSWSYEKTFSHFNDNRVQKLFTLPLEYLPLLLIKKVCMTAHHYKDHSRV